MTSQDFLKTHSIHFILLNINYVPFYFKWFCQTLYLTLFLFQHLTAILEFMYAGEVNVAQDQLPAFLKTAERLKVKGLAEAPQTIKQE